MSLVSWSDPAAGAAHEGSLGGAGAVTGEVQEGSDPSDLLEQPHKHISRSSSYSPGCLFLLSNRKCHFFNLPCSKEKGCGCSMALKSVGVFVCWMTPACEGSALTQPAWACFRCQHLHCYVGDSPTFQHETDCFSKVVCVFAKGTSVIFLRWETAALQLNNKTNPKSGALLVIKMMLAWKQRMAPCESWSMRK